MADFVLSASSVSTFLRCGHQWYLAYIEQRKSPPNIKQVLGIATHEAIEVNMRQKMSSRVDLPVSDVVDAFSTAYDREVTAVEDTDEHPGEVKDAGVQLVRKYQREVAPPIQPFWVEQPVQFTIDDQPVSGVLDLVEERIDSAFGLSHKVIRDTKTTARRPDKNNYLLAMTGYALGFRQATGEEEFDVVLDYLIRTKKPQYLPIASGGPVDGGQIVAFAAVVRQVAEAIRAGSFIPNGIFSNACGWCGYRPICPYAKAAGK